MTKRILSFALGAILLAYEVMQASSNNVSNISSLAWTDLRAEATYHILSDSSAISEPPAFDDHHFTMGPLRPLASSWRSASASVVMADFAGLSTSVVWSKHTNTSQFVTFTYTGLLCRRDARMQSPCRSLSADVKYGTTPFRSTQSSNNNPSMVCVCLNCTPYNVS